MKIQLLVTKINTFFFFSTVSTGLNALAAMTLKDFVFGCCHKTLSEERATVLTKSLALGYGIVSFALVFVVEHLGAVLQVNIVIDIH